MFINYYSEDALWDTVKVKLKYSKKPQQSHTGSLHQELYKYSHRLIILIVFDTENISVRVSVPDDKKHSKTT